MKKVLMKILALFSRLIIKKYQPQVIGITGSVGKTSTKEVLSFVLSNKFRVRPSIKNYNNEFGLPLSIIGMESPGKNIWGWIKVFWKAKKLLLFKDKNYPEILILEMGVDREGDMDYLLSIVKPNIGIITNISHSHLEYFGTLEKIKNEKSKLVKNLKKDGLAILNFDNKYLKDLPKEIKSKYFTYGLEEGSDFCAKDITFSLPDDLSSKETFGINFKLLHHGSIVPVFLPVVVSYHMVYSVLASLAISSYFDLNLLEVSNHLKEIPPVPGRMEVLSGIKNSVIIDDAYNASPESAFSALKTIEEVKYSFAKKIFVLGDMLELGDYSNEGHYAVGKKAKEVGVDILVTIGEKSLETARGAIDAGFSREKIFSFNKVEDAFTFLNEKISERDVVLIKASRGMKLEKLIEQLKKV
jgi:UDP-N-acetylmuramoyl-tripeptide--D-alanyl-D-alanine ligase